MPFVSTHPAFVSTQPEGLTAAAGKEHDYPLAAEADRGASATCR